MDKNAVYIWISCQILSTTSIIVNFVKPHIAIAKQLLTGKLLKRGRRSCQRGIQRYFDNDLRTIKMYVL